MGSKAGVQISTGKPIRHWNPAISLCRDRISGGAKSLKGRSSGPPHARGAAPCAAGLGQMNEPIFLLLTGLVAILVVPPVAVSLNERRMRRRHRLLAGRRKQKLRL